MDLSQLLCEKQSFINFSIMNIYVFFRFGRRTALLLSTLINAVFMVALAFSPNLLIYCIIRFAIGVGTGGSLIIGVVHVLEITGKQHREVAGAICLLPDGVAEASLAGFAYFTSGWQGYTLSYGVATCMIFVLTVFIPESPRWLVSNGKVDEAIELITSAAKKLVFSFSITIVLVLLLLIIF